MFDPTLTIERRYPGGIPAVRHAILGKPLGSGAEFLRCQNG